MQPTSPLPGAATRSRKKRVLLGLVLIPLVTAVSLEVGTRVIGRLRGKPFDAEELESDVTVKTRALSRRAFVPGGMQDDKRARGTPDTQVLQPYMAWEHMSTQELIVQGAAHYASARGEQALDICILGGSVAQTFGEKGAARLVELVQKDGRIRGREVLVHNYGCAGYKQPQMLMFLSYLLALGHAPDLVLEIDGFNDSALAWSNHTAGVHPSYPYHAFWGSVMKGLRPSLEWADLAHAMHVNQDRAAAFGEWFLASGLWHSAFLGELGRFRFAHLRGEYVAAYEDLRAYVAGRPKDGELKGPSFPTDDAALAREIVGVWEESSIGMQGICEVNGIAYLHVLQPTLEDEGSKPLSAKEIAGKTADPTWVEGVKRLYPLLREGGSRLRERGVDFFDASGIFREFPEDLYEDVCHLNQRGNDILADAIASAVTDALARGN